MKKTVVIGLDGATWDILKPFMEKGYMPHLQSLVDKGIHGPLESTIPNMTGPAWTTFVTGKHPGHHGVFDFMLPTDTLQSMKFATADDIQDITLYEILKQNGYTPILINLPVSWPPKLQDDITITSLLTQGDEWVFPQSLKEEFPDLQHYRLTPDESLRLKENDEAYIEDLLKHMDEQLLVTKKIYETKPWDFFFYLFSHSDWVSHLAYDKLLQHDQSSRRVFEKIDEYLGWFIEHLPEDANLIMLSDHGFRAFDKIFYFNKWLEQEGYLATSTSGDQFRGAVTRRAKETDKIRASKKSINIGSGVFSMLSTVPVAEKAAKWVYHRIVKPYLPVHVNVDVGIDFSKTKVCFPKGSYITNGYINKDWVYKNGTVSKQEFEPLRKELIEKISALKDPDGNPVVKEVLTREQVYGEHAPDQAPDIFFELADYWLVGQFHSGKLFEKEIHNKHGKYGIFLGYGPDFEQHAEVKNLMIQDLTPNILHLLGLPIPDDCDGRVALELFSQQSQARTRETKKKTYSSSTTQGPSSEKENIKKALGSISLK